MTDFKRSSKRLWFKIKYLKIPNFEWGWKQVAGLLVTVTFASILYSLNSANFWMSFIQYFTTFIFIAAIISYAAMMIKSILKN